MILRIIMISSGAVILYQFILLNESLAPHWRHIVGENFECFRIWNSEILCWQFGHLIIFIYFRFNARAEQGPEGSSVSSGLFSSASQRDSRTVCIRESAQLGRSRGAQRLENMDELCNDKICNLLTIFVMDGQSLLKRATYVIKKWVDLDFLGWHGTCIISTQN